jgi:hypothetical protein
MHAVNECSAASISDRSKPTLVALCIDCAFKSSSPIQLPSLYINISGCKELCSSSNGCVSIQYNSTSGHCLWNNIWPGNTNIQPLPSNSGVDVWVVVSNQTASGYANVTQTLTMSQRIRPELLRCCSYTNKVFFLGFTQVAGPATYYVHPSNTWHAYTVDRSLAGHMYACWVVCHWCGKKSCANAMMYMTYTNVLICTYTHNAAAGQTTAMQGMAYVLTLQEVLRVRVKTIFTATE